MLFIMLVLLTSLQTLPPCIMNEISDGHYYYDHTLNDAEIVELGISQQIISNDIYMPCNPNINRNNKREPFIRGYVLIDNEKGVKFYNEEDNKFILSAKKCNSEQSFYISTDEDFPLSINDKPTKGYVAKLVRQRDMTYILCLNNCRYCDEELKVFTCGRGLEQREVLAKIVHSVRRVNCADVDVRCVLVSIPRLSVSGKRKIWCPRTFKKENKQLPTDADVCDAARLTPSMCLKCVNKLPEWSSRLDSLVLKFQANRIMIPSSKNIIIFEESTYMTATINARSGIKDKKYTEDLIAADNCLMQFGKRTTDKFTLDYRHPLSPLQAFGIAISMLLFNGNNPNPVQMMPIPTSNPQTPISAHQSTVRSRTKSVNDSFRFQLNGSS